MRLFLVIFTATITTAIGQSSTHQFAERESGALQIDLHAPERSSEDLSPVVLWFHGGGWQKGSRERMKLLEWLTEEGYVIASPDYRLTTTAPFPAQIEDARAALDWIRSEGKSHGLDPERVVTAGLSAGAQIASLLALSDENEETPLIGFLHFFGPSDFIQMSRYTTDPEAPLNRSSSNVFLLFGGPLLENLPRAAEASPVTYLDESDPPSLIFVGDHDSLMNQRQCRRLYEASQEKGLESQLHIIPGAGHGGPEFSDATRKNLILTFLQSLQQ